MPVHKTDVPNLGNLGIDESAWRALDPSSRGVIRAACLTKALWTEQGARNSARRMRAELGELVRAYPCPFTLAGSHHWHVGHVPTMRTVQRLALAIRDLHGTRPTTRVDKSRGIPHT